jgi:hypothetical protein
MFSNKIIIVVLIVVLILLLFILCITFDEIHDDENKERKKIEESYLSISGHNVDDKTIDVYKDISNTVIETPEEELLVNNMLHNIERFNLHNEALVTRRRERMFNIIANNAQAVAVHVPFILDNTLDELRGLIEPFLVNIHIPVEERIVNHVDNQNVHDTAVNNSVRNMVERLLEIIPKKEFEDAKDEVVNFILNHKYDGNNGDKAVDVLDVISRNDIVLENIFKLSEFDILALVYARCKGDKEKEESLISAIVDAYENGGVVCTTGRINRIVSSLSSIDEEVGEPVMTKEMIRNEAFSKAGRIRDEMLEGKSDEFKKKYNSGDEDEEVKVFVDEVKNKITFEIRSDYAHLDKIKIDDIVRDACDGVA